jgi:hypothetical protein
MQSHTQQQNGSGVDAAGAAAWASPTACSTPTVLTPARRYARLGRTAEPAA